MAETDWMARGLEVAGKLWGARGGGRELPAQRISPEFFGLVAQFVFGMFWSRPNLDMRSRSLCTVAQLAALGKLDELRLHLHGALHLGITRDQVIEVLLQTACYAGSPARDTHRGAEADRLLRRCAGGGAGTQRRRRRPRPEGLIDDRPLCALAHRRPAPRVGGHGAGGLAVGPRRGRRPRAPGRGPR